jgi:hypothetical protein
MIFFKDAWNILFFYFQMIMMMFISIMSYLGHKLTLVPFCAILLPFAFT